MRSRALFMAVWAAGLVAGLAATSATAADDAPAPYSIRQATPSTGSNIPSRIVTGSLPFDKTYAQLSDTDRNKLRAQYERMDSADEPPYPAEGLGPLYKAIAHVQQRLMATGPLDLDVQVNSRGEATSVAVLKTPAETMGRHAAAVAMLTRYKPAVCAGQPCAMQFPIRIVLQRSL